MAGRGRVARLPGCLWAAGWGALAGAAYRAIPLGFQRGKEGITRCDLSSITLDALIDTVASLSGLAAVTFGAAFAACWQALWARPARAAPGPRVPGTRESAPRRRLGLREGALSWGCWLLLPAWGAILALDVHVHARRLLLYAGIAGLAWAASQALRARSVFLAAAVMFVAGALLQGGYRPAGDEPHYLLIAQSLIDDGDANVFNQHAEGQWHRFYPAEDLEFHGRRRLRDGDPWWFSMHLPGPSVLIAPGLALAGDRGARVVLALLSAAALACLWSAWHLWRRAGWLGVPAALSLESGAPAWASRWLFVAALCSPVGYYAYRLWPEGPAVFLVSLALWAQARSLTITGEPRRWAPALTLGFACGALLWMGGRFFVLSGALGLWFWCAARVSWRQRLLSLAPAGILAGILLLYSEHAFGTWWPGGGYREGDMREHGWAAVELLGNVMGELFDVAKGLVPYATWVLLLPAALWALPGDQRLRMAGLLSVALAQFVVLTLDLAPPWHGGFSPPSRYMVCLLPFAMIAAYPLVERAASWTRRQQALLVALSLPGMVASLGFWLEPRSSVEGDAGATLTVALFTLRRAVFPDWWEAPFTARTWALTGCWLVLAGVAAYFAARHGTRSAPTRPEPA